MSTAQHSFYILYSQKLDRYYIGSCSVPIHDRLRRHLSNHNGYTARVKDWKIVYSECFSSINLARKREFQVKKWKSRILIEQLIHSI